MRVFHFSVPIPDYCGVGVYYQDILFDASEPFPTKEEFVDILKDLERIEPATEHSQGTWKACIASVEKAEGYPVLAGSLVGTNSFVEVITESGSVRAPFSVQVRDVYRTDTVYRSD